MVANAGVGCLEKGILQLNVIGPKWQSCITFGASFGYLEGDTYKTVEGVIHEMIEVFDGKGDVDCSRAQSIRRMIGAGRMTFFFKSLG